MRKKFVIQKFSDYVNVFHALNNINFWGLKANETQNSTEF